MPDIIGSNRDDELEWALVSTGNETKPGAE